MKKIILILLFMYSYSIYGRNLYNQASWTSLVGWTKVGSFTTTFSGGEMTISGGVGSFASYMMQTGYGTTNLCNFDREFIFRPQTINSSKNILALGVMADNAKYPQTFQVGVTFSTDSTSGTFRLYKNGVALVVSLDTLQYSFNDRIKYTINRTGWTYTFKAINLTVPDTSYINYVVDPTVSATVLSTSGKFAIWAVLGTYKIESDIASTTESANPKIIFIGDSKTEGYGVAMFADNYPSKAMENDTNDFVIVAKGNNTTLDVLHALHEVIFMRDATKTQRAVLFIGCNDLRFGIPTTTWQANYLSIVTQLKSAGFDVLLLGPMVESLDQDKLAAYIKTITSQINVDLNPISVDKIHPNVIGYKYMGNTVSPFIK